MSSDDWLQVPADGDIAIFSRQALIEQGYSDGMGLTPFTIFIADDDGPQLAIQTYSVACVRPTWSRY